MASCKAATTVDSMPICFGFKRGLIDAVDHLVVEDRYQAVVFGKLWVDPLEASDEAFVPSD